ncbi:hypothetical protein BSL78_17513, partial [Apostichopus japonicus]
TVAAHRHLASRPGQVRSITEPTVPLEGIGGETGDEEEVRELVGVEMERGQERAGEERRERWRFCHPRCRRCPDVPPRARARARLKANQKPMTKTARADSPSGRQRAAPVVVRAKRGAPESQGRRDLRRSPEQTFPSDPRKARLKANKKPIRSSDQNGRNVRVEESGTRRGTHTEIGSGSPSPAREAGGEREEKEILPPKVPAPKSKSENHINMVTLK